MPEVDTLHGYSRTLAKQVSDHLRALGVDSMMHRERGKEDWVGLDGKHWCQYIKILHKSVNVRLMGDPSLPNDTLVHILRV